MKDYIFTYDALKKIKDAGGVLNWEEISEQQLKYLYLDEDILSSTIADLYNVTNSKVAYKRQKFKIKKMITQVRHKLLSDQKENLKKHLNLITQKEIDEFLEINDWVASQYKSKQTIEFPPKYKKILDSNKRMFELVMENIKLIPSNDNSISLNELKEILGTHFHEIEKIGKQNNNTIWLEVFRKDEYSNYYPILIPDEMISTCLLDVSLSLDCANYEDIYSFSKNTIVIGTERKPKPLVFIRNFLNIKESYIEILEEFRLFHNLFYDKKTDNYYKIYENGSEEEVIVKKENSINIKSKYLKELLTYKEMSLLLFFDVKKDINTVLYDQIYVNETFTDTDFKFNVIIYSTSDDKDTMKYCGKKIIRGFKSQEKIPQITHYFDGSYVDFIVDSDEYGKPIEFSCNPDKLSYWEVHKSGLNFDSEVYFKRKVLSKYYREYEKYSIKENCLRCGNFWELPFESINPNYVIVKLGNLGKILNYEEQLYWKCYNTPPNWIYTEENPDSLSKDFIFLKTFQEFQNKWIKKYNWYLFKPLSESDQYHLKTLHIPFADNLNEFEEQVRSLVKIFIDSINEKEIKKIINKPELKGSILLLENYFKAEKLQNFDSHLNFLRKLQTLRSVGIAHRKSSKYEEIAKYFKINKKPVQAVFCNILDNIIKIIKYIEKSLFI